MKIRVFQFTDGSYLLSTPELVKGGLVDQRDQETISFRKTRNVFKACQFGEYGQPVIDYLNGKLVTLNISVDEERWDENHVN